MAKGVREIKESIKLVDIIYYMLDARAPISSMNYDILDASRGKKIILLFNKVDLSDRSELKKYIKYYSDMGYPCLEIDAKNIKIVKDIINLSKKILLEKNLKLESRGLKEKEIKSIVLGIPNVGKSTLINTISKKRIMEVKNFPGVTRNISWSKLSEDIFLLDTPGVLLPKLDEKTGLVLSIIGSIKDSILPEMEVMKFALSFLLKKYPLRLKEKYNIVSGDTIDTMLEKIYKSRNLQGEVDYSRVFVIFLKDIRDYKLGGLIFDDLER
jgi:ribosome biogenesis GTPase A